MLNAKLNQHLPITGCKRRNNLAMLICSMLGIGRHRHQMATKGQRKGGIVGYRLRKKAVPACRK
jgi:hypothetical protein